MENKMANNFDLVEREIAISDFVKGKVNLNNPVLRFPQNPILTCHDVNRIWKNPALQVNTIHNAGVAIFEGETLLLFRSHLRSGVSLLGIARSKNGFTDWRIDPRPAMFPATADDLFYDGVNREALIENEAGGVEDPRISRIGDDYLITYSAYHARVKNRVRVSLAATKDFKHFTRYGPVLDRDMRNVVVFPEKINGKYVGLFRPNGPPDKDVDGIYTEIRIGFTDDWRSNDWEILLKPIMKTGGGPSAISDKIGPGAPPLKTKYGWLHIFHGVRATMAGNPYVLSVMLHDLKNPAKIKVSNIPILFPSRADCRVPASDYVHVDNALFTCGALRREDGVILIYYAGNDTVMNIGISHEDVLKTLCEAYGQDPLAGTRLYGLK